VNLLWGTPCLLYLRINKGDSKLCDQNHIM
jgi:hypothetical protein